MGWSAGNRKGLTVLDAVITLSIIAVFFGVVVTKYQQVAQEAKKSALRAELANIRSTIKLFKMLNRRNPDSMQELVEKEVLFPARIGSDKYSSSVFQQKYLMPNAVDEKGNILDAFGNPFTYDQMRGEVRTTTKGYENW